MQTSIPSPLHAWYASAHSCASTKKEFSFKPMGERNDWLTPAADNRITCGLSPVYQQYTKRFFVSGCRPVGGRLFVSVNPFHARHVRERNGSGQLSTVPSGAGGTVARPRQHPVLPSPAGSRCPAVRCADLFHARYVRVLESTNRFT